MVKEQQKTQGRPGRTETDTSANLNQNSLSNLEPTELKP